MNSLQITKKVLGDNSLIAKKAFGQNFLTDDIVLERIVNSTSISEETTVVEIGPGIGNLTEYLLDRKAKVIAIELDKDMVDILEKRFKDNQNLTVINEDILKIDISRLAKGNKVKVIANLPYYITTPILFKMIEQKEYISEIIVMVQKEVADRIVATPHNKEFGVLTIMINSECRTERLFNVEKTSFLPVPNVTSAIVRILPENDRYNIKDKKLFDNIVKKAFAMRRKKMINSLNNSDTFALTKEEWKRIFNSLEISENARAEELDIEQYIKICNKIKELNL